MTAVSLDPFDVIVLTGECRAVLDRYTAAVVAAERERCARLAEGMALLLRVGGWPDRAAAVELAAARIRRRPD